MGLLRSRLGRRRLSPFLVLLLRGSRLFRLPRHRDSSVPHPLIPGGGGGGGGGRDAAPPAPLASRSVRLTLTLRSSFPPPLLTAPRAPPPPPATQGPLRLAARARARPTQTLSGPIGEEEQLLRPTPHGLSRSSVLGSLPHTFLQPIRKRLQGSARGFLPRAPVLTVKRLCLATIPKSPFIPPPELNVR